MKKISIALIIIAGIACAARAETLLASTNAQSVLAPTQYGPQYHVAVDNASDVIIYARPNVPVVAEITTNFYNGVANITTSAVFSASSATPIPPGKSFSFPIAGVDGNRREPVVNVSIEAGEGTNKTVHIGFNQ